MNKHYYKSEKRNFNKKNIRGIIFWGIICVENGGFDESDHNTKKTKSSLERVLLEVLVCKILLNSDQ